MGADHLSIVVCAGAVLWHLTQNVSVAARVAALTLLSGALFVPFGGHTGLEIAAATVGSLSVTTLVVSILLLLSSIRKLPLARSEQVAGTLLIIVVGSVLYASAFGFWRLDVYALGLESRHLLVLTTGLLVASTVLLWRYVPIIIVAVLLSYTAQILPSANWFDYLIDPALWIGAFVALILQWQGRRGRAAAREVADVRGAGA